MPAQVRVDPTPNPNSLKITLDRAVSAKARTFADAASAADEPLAARLFAVEGVRSVFMVANFVTVTKDPAAPWEGLSERLGRIVAEHFGA